MHWWWQKVHKFACIAHKRALIFTARRRIRQCTCSSNEPTRNFPVEESRSRIITRAPLIAPQNRARFSREIEIEPSIAAASIFSLSAAHFSRALYTRALVARLMPTCASIRRISCLLSPIPSLSTTRRTFFFSHIVWKCKRAPFSHWRTHCIWRRVKVERELKFAFDCALWLLYEYHTRAFFFEKWMLCSKVQTHFTCAFKFRAPLGARGYQRDSMRVIRGN